MRRRITVPLTLTLAAGVLTPVGATAEEPLPTPESVIGWAPCADYRITTYERTMEYFRALDAASDRVQLVDVGTTTEGRRQQMAIISSEENLANIDEHKATAERLARAEDVDEAEARTLSSDGKAVAWVDFGIHTTEIAPHQLAPRFAYNLANSEAADVRRIRDNVITIVVPSINPDGQTYLADWYAANRGRAWEMRLPELYQHYAGHDNNRDWYMFNLDETRNIGNQLFNEWYPQVMHNAHQTAPNPARIFIPPFEDPVNPNIDPRVTRGVNLIGSAMSRRLDDEGKAGAVSNVQFDMWWNGGLRSTPYYHNMIGILTETAHANPNPVVNNPANFPATFANGESTRIPSIFYPSPYLGGEWHLADSCAYIESATLGMLDVVGEKPDEFLYNIWAMGSKAIADGSDELYVIPADQADTGTAARLVNVLRHGGIEVEAATRAFTLNNTTYPRGSWIVRGAQAFRAHLTDMLNPQEYPLRRTGPGGPIDAPYDITGYTLSFQMGVDVDKIEGDISGVRIRTEPVDVAVPPPGTVDANPGFAWALDPRDNATFTVVNRMLEAGETVRRVPTPISTSLGSWPAGAFLVEEDRGTRGRLRAAVRELGVTTANVATDPGGTTVVEKPRVGLYHAWGGNMDEGWTRYLLEDFELDYTRLHDAAVRAGNLRASYDVIVLPDATLSSMQNGLAANAMPAQYTGGMTAAGVQNLRTFVEQGGTLLTFDTASQLPIRAFGLPVTDVTTGVDDEELNIPGSVLGIDVDNTHPVAYGMPADASAFYDASHAFTSTDPSVRTVATYAPADELLRSGFAIGGELVAGKAAVVEASLGEGQVVMLGFRAQHRAQAHGTFKLIFNSLYR
ncbi:M14 family zinc carboxypeptidase [Motilibacter aurantiacus]|uniref:M14 family zinc carboxypeptidase n=1 Tax=Motilibacter aurantiacus TaxID=2714955 RepID=UPI00140DF751|nr:peptidase M14 [Motilibacter aurantiacus]